MKLVTHRRLLETVDPRVIAPGRTRASRSSASGRGWDL